MSLDPLRNRRTVGWNLLSLLALASVATPFACNSNDTGNTTSGNTAAVTNGTGYDPVCEGGTRDGFCDALGAKPESCMCLDCAQTAYCKKTCQDDGMCNPAAGEDCTCIDCVGQSVNGQECQLSMSNGNGNGNGNGPASSAAATSGAGGAGGGSASSAATTAAATTAAATTAAATTAASTGTGM